jgi:hypothetical protein
LGFPTGRSSTRHEAIFLAPLPGIESEEAPTSTTRSHVNYAPATIFLALLPGRKRISAREVSRFQSFTLLLFCFILFLLASFYKKYKKLVPLIVGILLLLLLVYYVVP